MQSNSKPLTTKYPKAETFETGKVYPMYYWEAAIKSREWNSKPFTYSQPLTFDAMPNVTSVLKENAKLKKENDKIRKSYFEVDGENVALRQNVEEITKEIDKLKQFCNSPFNYLELLGKYTSSLKVIKNLTDLLNKK